VDEIGTAFGSVFMELLDPDVRSLEMLVLDSEKMNAYLQP